MATSRRRSERAVSFRRARRDFCRLERFSDLESGEPLRLLRTVPRGALRFAMTSTPYLDKTPRTLFESAQPRPTNSVGIDLCRRSEF